MKTISRVQIRVTELFDWIYNESVLGGIASWVWEDWFAPVFELKKEFNIIGLFIIFPLVVIVWGGLCTFVFIFISSFTMAGYVIASPFLLLGLLFNFMFLKPTPKSK